MRKKGHTQGKKRRKENIEVKKEKRESEVDC